MENKESVIEKLVAEQFRSKIENLKRDEKKRSEKTLRTAILFATVLISLMVAITTFVVQEKRKLQFSNILEKELMFRTYDIQKLKEETKVNLHRLRSDIQTQQERIQKLSVPVSADIDMELRKQIDLSIEKMNSLEARLLAFDEAKIIEKMSNIENAMEGDVTKLLSVPLLKSDLSNFKKNAEKELIKLEKKIEKLDARLSFFVTTTITLTLGIFTAVIAPLFISYLQRRGRSLAERVDKSVIKA